MGRFCGVGGKSGQQPRPVSPLLKGLIRLILWAPVQPTTHMQPCPVASCEEGIEQDVNGGLLEASIYCIYYCIWMHPAWIFVVNTAEP
jgi:hypothetical protein